MKYVVTHGQGEINLEVELRDDGRYNVKLEGRDVVADLRPAGGHSLYSLILEQEAYDVSVVENGERTTVSLRGMELRLRVESEQARNARLVEASTGSQGPHTLMSIMPGRVVRVLVREGEEVACGTPLLIIEAMKMENEIRSVSAGTVSRILVSDGQTVVNGDPLVTIG